MVLYLFFVLFSLYYCTAYKFLVYSPIFGYSHVKFMGAIADALTEAGHNVTILMPVMDKQQENKTGVKITKNILKLEPEERVIEIIDHQHQTLRKMWTMDADLLSLIQMTGNMTKSFTYQCEDVINDEELLKMLEKEKFDVGIAELFDICGLGIFEVIKIPATISTFAGVYVDIVSECIGEPIMPSFVPGGLSVKGDRMNFMERVINLVNVFFGKMFFAKTYVSEENAFRKKFGPQFKDYKELIAKSSFVLTNSNPYLDYPRPTLHKTIPIGGITVDTDPKTNKLPKKWDNILSKRNTTVLVSFGSVAQSIYMPDQYRKTLLQVFERMPDTTFIWKYEEEHSTIVDHLANVHLSSWLPQNALLADPRLTVFITHGGLGSTTEIAFMGKPAILIPVFADQTRNAYMLTKHGGGIVLTKNDLEHPQKLIDTLYKIFNDPKFIQNAHLLAEILQNQPISAKELLVRHSEFTAMFGSLPNLDSYGRHLSFIQYYLIDIVLACVCIAVVFVFVTFKIMKKCFTWTRKTKLE